MAIPEILVGKFCEQCKNAESVRVRGCNIQFVQYKKHYVYGKSMEKHGNPLCVCVCVCVCVQMCAKDVC